MIPAAFDYHRPASIADALQLLDEYGFDAKIMSGGHSLVPAMKLRLARPGHVIDISALEEIGGIHINNDQTITIGAGVTHYDIESSIDVQQHATALAQAAASIGDVQVRNQGTIGGSLAHADPAADYPAAILACRSEIIVESLSGRRTIAADDFFIDIFETALEDEEIVVGVRIPLATEARAAYRKFPHPASGFAVVGCAAVATIVDGTFADIHVAFTGLSNCPFRDHALESALCGQPADRTTIRRVASQAAVGREFLSDTFASESYRAHLAGVYAERTLTALLD